MKVFLLATIFLLASCAQAPKKQTKTYSPEVEKSFEDIEREKAIALYKKLRWENWKKIQRQRKALKPKSRKKYKRPTVKRKKTYYAKPRKPKKPSRPPLSDEKMKEVKIEISQNMSIYCMAKRKDKRFKNENDCHAFTQNVLDNCQDKVQQPWVDKSIVRCVKRKLKY